ncbi:MAG: hypothetical protein KGD67_11690, partial [Candidatus Lokiarchaeota archaeon]|nr:hypothetical protein [Candidatus Lokiarchaeota archaeon]
IFIVPTCSLSIIILKDLDSIYYIIIYFLLKLLNYLKIGSNWFKLVQIGSKGIHHKRLFDGFVSIFYTSFVV